MSFLHSLFFGLVEGLTEFIPVSSTAHMLLLQHALGIRAGDDVFAYLVLVQLGPLAALLLHFREEIWSLGKALLQKRSSGSEPRLGYYIVAATLPALVAGALFRDSIRFLFQTPLAEAAIRLLAAAFLLALAEWIGKRTRSLDSMTWIDALFVGLFQVLAVIPGASRSGTTISAGMLRNFDRPAATRFAFLLSAPVMLAAALFESASALRLGHLGPGLPMLAVGLAVSFISGWLSIRWLLRYVSSHSLCVFAAYCAIMGALSLVLLWT